MSNPRPTRWAPQLKESTNAMVAAARAKEAVVVTVIEEIARHRQDLAHDDNPNRLD